MNLADFVALVIGEEKVIKTENGYSVSHGSSLLEIPTGTVLLYEQTEKAVTPLSDARFVHSLIRFPEGKENFLKILSSLGDEIECYITEQHLIIHYREGNRWKNRIFRRVPA